MFMVNDFYIYPEICRQDRIYDPIVYLYMHAHNHIIIIIIIVVKRKDCIWLTVSI